MKFGRQYLVWTRLPNSNI